jgi:hypothetical protein
MEKIFTMKMVHSLAIRLIKKGSVQALKIKGKNNLVAIDDIRESVAIELIRDKMIHAIQFYNRFNVLEYMEIAND